MASKSTSSASSANLWVKFFVAAGVPSATSAKYAHVFHENRIQMDMLGDLNKEYLREMGINTLGDIIAILRHSKSVHERTAQEKYLAQDDDDVIVVPDTSSSPIMPSVPARSKSSNGTAAIVPKQPQAAAVRTASPVKSAKTVATTTTTTAITSSGKPARRVLPEHEGRYKITLPAGTTARSKEILAKKAMLHSDQPNNGRRGIFDRLELNCDSNGSHSNGSTTTSSSNDSPIRTGNSSSVGGGTTLNITIQSDMPTTTTSTTPAANATSATSIFKRLGGKAPASHSSNTVLNSPATASALRVQQQQQSTVQRTISGLAKRPVISAISASACISAVSSKARAGLVAGGGGVAKKLPQQKVILVKKQPAKATRPDVCDVSMAPHDFDDDTTAYRPNRSGSEKCVSFSEEDEVLEFATEKPRPSPSGNASKVKPKPKPAAAAASSVHAIVPVKHRLGFTANTAKPTSSASTATGAAAAAALHRTRKTVPLKASPEGRPATSSTVLRRQYTAAVAAGGLSKSARPPVSRVPIQSRLTLNASKGGNASGGRPLKPTPRASVTSVFQRLGFTD